MKEINDCPFCAYSGRRLELELGDRGIYFHCLRCGATSPEETDINVLIDKWNSISSSRCPRCGKEKMDSEKQLCNECNAIVTAQCAREQTNED